MVGLATDSLSQVSGTIRWLRSKVPPVRNVLVKVQQGPGPVLPLLGQHALNMVKVFYLPGYCEVHRAEITHQALEIFPANVMLSFRNSQKCEDFMYIFLRGGELFPPPYQLSIPGLPWYSFSLSPLPRYFWRSLNPWIIRSCMGRST